MSSVALVDAAGFVVSGIGTAEELAVLAVVARPASRGTITPLCEELTEGTDILASEVVTPAGTMILAALGERVARMHEAMCGVARILCHA
ncbi:MAG: hypothetical protein JWP97_1769 [Labilithrix sp.]|nr:hypothetical protein [Labilithrix sp.]